jgi:cyanophycin synthetase
VMELGCDNLIRLGMPVDKCDVAAVLDVELGPPRQDGIDSVEDLAAVELLVPGTASHYAVLNADDAHCVNMAKGLQHVPICWVSLDPDNPVIKTLDSRRGMAATLSRTGQDVEIMITATSQRQCVASIRDILMPFKGTHLKEALFAIAIAYALEIPLEHIRTGLNSFQHDLHRD